MRKKTENKVKQSFVLGSLTSSAGVFLSKVIGLFYVVPFTSIAGEENMVFYSSAYTYYNVLLLICSAGLPYAIASVIAKYANNEDYKTVLLARKLGTGILSVMGFAMALIFTFASGTLSNSVLGESATATDLSQMRTCFCILALALFLVPILYSYRSFYQGLKDMKVYADSQVIEQFVRVISLLGLGAIVVYVLHFNQIWSIYMAVLSTSIGALAAILYYVRYDRSHIGTYRRLARSQEKPSKDTKLLLQEMFAFGLPYLITSFFGNSQTLINTNYFIPVTTSFGMSYETAKLLYGIIQVQCDKLTSIPQVLGIGFSAGLVPYMTIALENQDYKELRKNIHECFGTVLYIGLPICFLMFYLARPIYYVMYGGANLDYGESALQYSCLLALATTITPICNSMMMTLHLRKECMFYLGIGFVVKCVTFYPLIKYTGYSGAITSSVLCSATIIYLCMAKISNKFSVSYKKDFKLLLRLVLACIAMNAPIAILRMVGFQFSETNRILCLAQLALEGILSMVVYFITTSIMQAPEMVFHQSLLDILHNVIKSVKKS